MAGAKERHPEVFIQRNEDPRNRKRTVPMQVLSLGYSRTGTMTMQAALEMLGIKTWHWVNQAENQRDLAMWTECLEAKWEPESGIKPFGREEFDNLLGQCMAITDQPAVIMAEELLEAYPETKVILVERDVENWFRSYSAAVIEGAANPFIPLATLIDSQYIRHMAKQTDLIAKHYFNVHVPRTSYGIFNNADYFRVWRENARDTYRKHNDMVKRVTPPEKLLKFNLADGWEPLCHFLDKAVPDVPFPRINETEALQEKVNLYIGESYRRTAVRFLRKTLSVAITVCAVAFLWTWVCTYR